MVTNGTANFRFADITATGNSLNVCPKENRDGVQTRMALRRRPRAPWAVPKRLSVVHGPQSCRTQVGLDEGSCPDPDNRPRRKTIRELISEVPTGPLRSV